MEFDKLGGGLMNAILGGLILWVAQTTFHHSGELAGVSQKFDSVVTQHDNLRTRLDGLMSNLNERTRSRFTGEDGEKLAGHIDEVALFAANLERRLIDRITELQVKLIALETQGVDQRELARLRTDVERLDASLFAPTQNERNGSWYGSSNVARSRESMPNVTR